MRIFLQKAGLLPNVRNHRDTPQAIAESSEQPRRMRVLQSERKILFCFVCVSFLVRWFLLKFEDAITPDGVYYAILGEKLLAGDFLAGLSTYWPPLYPILVGLSAFLFGDLELGGRMVSVVAGSLLVLPVYYLIRDSYGRKAACLGAFLVTFYPQFLYYSTKLLTESTYTLLFTVSVYYGWRSLSEWRAKYFAFVGMGWAGCYLLRPEAIGFALLMAVLAVAVWVFSGKGRWIGAVARAAVLIVAFLAVSFPYILYLRQETGRWTVSEKYRAHTSHGGKWEKLIEGGAATWMDKWYGGVRVAARPSAAPPVQASRQQSSFVGALLGRLKFALVNLNIEQETLLPGVLLPFLVCLVGVGLFKRRWSRGRARRELYLLLIVFASLLGYAWTVPNARYLVPILPILIVWSSKGVVEFHRWLVQTVSLQCAGLSPVARRVIQMLVVAGVFLLMLPKTLDTVTGDKWDQPFEQKEAGLWIKGRRPGLSPVVMANSPVAAFYAGGEHWYLPNEEYLVLMQHARRKNVDYIVVDQRLFVEKRLRFQEALLDEVKPHPGLKLVYWNQAFRGYEVVVYEVLRLAHSPAEALTAK